MNTGANIIIKDNYDKLFFYRHSDGYPSGTLPTLKKFLDLVKKNKIRQNVSQSSGWLILIGSEEYGVSLKSSKVEPFGWKVGAYEPTTGIHGNIQFLYIIDLIKKTIEVIEKDFDKYNN